MNSNIIIGRRATGFNGGGNSRQLASRRGGSAGWPLAKSPGTPRHVMRLLAGLFPLWLAAVPAATPPRTNTAPAALANRYLFIVETSKTMRSRGDGTLNAIHDLLASGMRGQMQAGDTLGLWTFNRELHMGEFPLQQWSPKSQKGVTGRVLTFLKDQRCENKPRFDQVLPALQRVVRNSQFITVVLVTSGEEDLRGTPFDEPINRLCKSWRKQQAEANMPVITVLRGQNGQFAEYRVSPAPWATDLPPLPKELQAARVKPKTASAASAQAAPATVPPLIVSGRKPKPAPAPAAVPSSPSSISSAPAVVVTTNLTPAASLEATPAPTPAATVAKPPTEAAKTTIASTTVPPADPPAAARTDAPARVEPAPPATPPVEAKLADPPASPRQPQETVSAPPATIPRDAGSQAESAASAAAPPLNPTASPAVVAATTEEPSFLENKLVWLAALLGAGLLGGLVWCWRCRSRTSEPISLITRSLEQHKH